MRPSQEFSLFSPLFLSPALSPQSAGRWADSSFQSCSAYALSASAPTGLLLPYPYLCPTPTHTCDPAALHNAPWKLMRVILGTCVGCAVLLSSRVTNGLQLVPGTTSSKFGTSCQMSCGCRSLVTTPLSMGLWCRSVVCISSRVVKSFGHTVALFLASTHHLSYP